MATITTPNMNMAIPIPGSEPGPQWSYDLNAALTIVDSHNHSSGQGVPIQPNGMNINADLPFNSNNATLLRSSRFVSQPSALALATDIGCLYVVGNELYYNDVTGGHQIQVTNNGSVNAGAGSIGGLPSGTASVNFAAGTYVFQSATNTAANIDGASIVFRNSGANSKGLTLNPPASMAANITQTLPTIPASVTSIMQMDTSGNMSAALTVDGATLVNTANVLAVGAASIGPTQLVATPITSSSQIAAGTIVSSNIASGTIAADRNAAATTWFGASSGTLSMSSGTTTVISVSAFIPLSGRPWFYAFGGNTVTPSNTGNILVPAGSSATFTVTAGLQTVNVCTIDCTSAGAVAVPVSALNTFSAGLNVGSTHTTTLQCKVNSSAGGPIVMTYCQMEVIQI